MRENDVLIAGEWRISWRSIRTGEIGHSEPIYSEDDARQIAAVLNDEPTLADRHHWAELPST